MKEAEKSQVLETKGTPKQRGSVQGPGNFFKEVRAELKRVEWPARHIVIRSSLLVLLVMVIFVLFVGGIDMLLSKIFYALKALRAA